MSNNSTESLDFPHVFLLITLALSWVCSRVNKPNVFLAVLDAVRPDHLSCYGYSTKTTPNIDRIAQEGVLFENAFSAAPWTPPSHASIFTGMYPSQHGVLGKNLYLDKEIPTMAQTFSSMGYETLGICRTPWVSSQTGLNRGFKKFISGLNRSRIERTAPRLSLNSITFCLETDIRSVVYNWSSLAGPFEEIKKWILSSQKRDKPFFIFANYFDAHTPYNPPQPFKKKFEKLHKQNTDLEKIMDVFNSRHGYPYVAKETDVSEEEWDVLKSWYDGEIAYIDFFLGKLFDYLKRRALFDDTFIVITSDHGENFGEHQLANHVFCLYDTLLHVPLIMRYPEHTPERKRIPSIVSHTDIFSTLFSILNTESHSRTSGVNLAPFQERIHHESVYAEYGPPVADIEALKRLSPNVDPSICARYNKNLKCVRSHGLKYIVASDGKEELYDLKKDPAEKTNVTYKFPEKLQELRSLLTSEFRRIRPKEKASTFDDQMKRRLRKLGYF